MVAIRFGGNGNFVGVERSEKHKKIKYFKNTYSKHNIYTSANSVFIAFSVQ
jgi:hypothetical protein